jgi:hypothetical protein
MRILAEFDAAALLLRRVLTKIDELAGSDQEGTPTELAGTGISGALSKLRLARIALKNIKDLETETAGDPPPETLWTRDELAKALRAHGSEIREADEWRPLAGHVLALLELRERQAQAVIDGLLEVARHVMPDTFWASDSRVNAARELLGDRFPTDEVLENRFHARQEYRDQEPIPE